MEYIKRNYNNIIILAAISALVLIFAKPANYEYRPIIITNVTRSLNTSYRPNMTRYTLVSISTTITSPLGDSGTITLQTSPDNSTWTTLETFSNDNVGVGVSHTQDISSDLMVTVKPGDYYRFETSGTSTFAILIGQETSL